MDRPDLEVTPLLELRPVAARSLRRSLVRQYGLFEGERAYYAMERERKGPFADGAKYGGRPREVAPPPRPR